MAFEEHFDRHPAALSRDVHGQGVSTTAALPLHPREPDSMTTELPQRWLNVPRFPNLPSGGRVMSAPNKSNVPEFATALPRMSIVPPASTSVVLPARIRNVWFTSCVPELVKVPVLTNPSPLRFSLPPEVSILPRFTRVPEFSNVVSLLSDPLVSFVNVPEFRRADQCGVTTSRLPEFVTVP